MASFWRTHTGLGTPGRHTDPDSCPGFCRGSQTRPRGPRHLVESLLAGRPVYSSEGTLDEG